MHAPATGAGKKLPQSRPGRKIIHTRIDGGERSRAPGSRSTEGMADVCGSALPRIRRTGLVRNVSRIRGASHEFRFQAPQNMPEKALWTIGHSTRTLKDFLTLLRKNGIQLLADVRRFPGSRKFPHFNRQELADTLQAEGSAYLHFPGL